MHQCRWRKGDQCFNSGVITTTSNRNTYSAGIIGYCRGHIDNCYNTGNIDATDGGHYIAGIVGLLQDSNPQARLQYCYSTGTVTDVGAGYCQALFAKTDNSTTMTIANCFWLDTISVGQSTGSGWGNCVNVAAATEAQLKGTAVYSGSDYVLDYLNNFVSSKKPYSQTAGSYPALTWEGTTFLAPATGVTPGSVGEDTDDQSMIFLDGTASTNGTGSKTSPFNNMTSAINAVDNTRNVIYITGQVTLSSAAGTWSAPAGISSLTIKRSSTYSGYLVEVAEGGSLTLEDITVDGNKRTSINTGGIVTSCNALFNVTRSTYNGTAGSLTIGSGAVLRNSFANSGAAVRIYGGNATLNGGTLTGNDALTNGGAVAVYRWIPGPSGGSRDDNDDRRAEKEFRPGSFTLSSGTISGNNAANYGGAVYLGMSQNSITINGGTIGGASSATANNAVCGGGVYMERNTSFTMTDGVIDSNTATTGPGVFLNSDGTLMPTFTVSPLSSSFDIDDVIYLNTNAKILIGNSLVNTLTIECANPSQNLVVAQGTDYTLLIADQNFFAYSEGGWHFALSSNTIKLLEDEKK